MSYNAVFYSAVSTTCLNPPISTGEKISTRLEMPSTLPRMIRKDTPKIRLPRNVRHGYLLRTVHISYGGIQTAKPKIHA